MKEIAAGHQETSQTKSRAVAGPDVGLVGHCTVRKKEVHAGHQEIHLQACPPQLLQMCYYLAVYGAGRSNVQSCERAA